MLIRVRIPGLESRPETPGRRSQGLYSGSTEGWAQERTRCWGERSTQRGLWEADHLYLDLVGRETFYGVLALLRGQLCSVMPIAPSCTAWTMAASSVPPCLLATALLLQTYDQASDAEDKAKADFDIRWKVGPGD